MAEIPESNPEGEHAHGGSASVGPSRVRARRSNKPGRLGGDTTPIRVLSVDDHAVVREGLRAQFELDDRIEVVATRPDATDLAEAIQEHRPDVILLDVEMPGPDAFEMVARVGHSHPEARVVILSAHVRDGFLAAAYRCGAWGYFAKADDLDALVAAITEIADAAKPTFLMGPTIRERCQPGASSSSGRSEAARPVLAPRLETLTLREVEVLRLIGRGMSRQEIAKELARSPKTIDGHQERMMRKLAIESRSELMRFAIREGLAQA